MKTLVKYLFQETIAIEADNFIKLYEADDPSLFDADEPAAAPQQVAYADEEMTSAQAQPQAPSSGAYEPSEIEGPSAPVSPEDDPDWDQKWYDEHGKSKENQAAGDAQTAQMMAGMDKGGSNLGTAGATLGVAAAGVAYLVYKKMKAARMSKGEPSRMAGANASKAAMMKLKQGMMKAKAKGDRSSMARIAKEIPKYASKIKG